MASEWKKFLEQERQRLQQEQAAQEAREREGIISEQQKAILAHKQQLEAEKGRQICKELVREAREVYQLDAIAESIKQDWERFGVPVRVTKEQRPDVALNDNGTVKHNRSRVDISLSYSYPDINISEETIYGSDGSDAGSGYKYSYDVETPTTKTETLTITYGYFNEKDKYASYYGSRTPTNPSIPYIPWDRGIKGLQVGQIIPIQVPDSQKLFFELLSSWVNDKKPENYIHAARERVRIFNQGMGRR